VSRSLKKGPFIEPKLLAKAAKSKAGGGRDAIKTWSRRSTIVPDFVNLSFLVHNGKTFVKVFVTEDMVGHKLGEFAPTRSFRGHPGTKGAEEGAKPAGGKG
jgi:small subunit ribosomal protein S19